MIKIPFTKMQGAGNDFLVLDACEGLDYAAFARQACPRNMGVGADGVLILDASMTCDYRMRIINADGSEAEMCGNGARCMAVYVARKFTTSPSVFSMETLAGTIQASVQGDEARVRLSDPKDYRPGVDLSVFGQTMTAFFINTGVPHAVIFVDKLNDVDVNVLGRAIRHHALFAPKGANVNFVERMAVDAVALRTYERGVEAETLACGTGSVAAALVGFLEGIKILKPREAISFKVLTRSGESLNVCFDLGVRESRPQISNVWLQGKGTEICRGDFFYKEPGATQGTGR